MFVRLFVFSFFLFFFSLFWFYSQRLFPEQVVVVVVVVVVMVVVVVVIVVITLAARGGEGLHILLVLSDLQEGVSVFSEFGHLRKDLGFHFPLAEVDHPPPPHPCCCHRRCRVHPPRGAFFAGQVVGHLAQMLQVYDVDRNVRNHSIVDHKVHVLVRPPHFAFVLRVCGDVSATTTTATTVGAPDDAPALASAMNGLVGSGPLAAGAAATGGGGSALLLLLLFLEAVCPGLSLDLS